MEQPSTRPWYENQKTVGFLLLLMLLLVLFVWLLGVGAIFLPTS
jgi:hypothetical protein